MTVDDGSGTTLKCSKFTYNGAHNTRKLIGRVFEVQGYIIHHSLFGREIRVVQINECTCLDHEIASWSEALKLRREVLSKHWNYGKRTDSILSSNPRQTVSISASRTSPPCNSYSLDQEMAWRLGSLAPTTTAPLLFCSFDRKNSVLSESGAVIETELGVTPSQAYKKKKHMSTIDPTFEPQILPLQLLAEHHERRQLLPPSSPHKHFREYKNLNTVFYGDSYREMTPILTHKIPRSYGHPQRKLGV